MSTREEVVVYTARTCPYCVRAERLLKRKRVDYERVAIWRFSPEWSPVTCRPLGDPAPHATAVGTQSQSAAGDGEGRRRI
ncbi:MAG: hypothetical protein M3Z33_06515 [Actinomycetota bacterium]|nr:hypothetical protein [Actinomycetota bacterium]